MKEITCFFLALFISVLEINAQANICENKVDYAWLQANAPSRYQRFMALENFTANYVATSGRLINPDGLIIIPVVVHVLHNGEALGVGKNLSLSAIQNQITLLNQDFRRLNADRINTPATFQSIAADFNIEFRLACIDPQGNTTNGVVRKQTSKAYFTYAERVLDKTANDETIGIKISSTGDPAWPTNRYLNIWTANLHLYAGYSTKPADYSVYPQFDGVVIDYRTVAGAPTAIAGRTLTHEVGHWLNLRHLDGDAFCGDDFCNDTPAEQSAVNNANTAGGCPSYPLTSGRCNTANPSVMFMNFMEFVNDNCLNLFTNDQKKRARAIFASNAPQARAAQLNGFFGFTNQPSSIVCSGSVIVNSICLPATWTVSGPATIVSGQNTYKLTIQATANGTVHLTATSGNYFAETDIPVTVTPPAISITPTPSSCSGGDYQQWNMVNNTINNGTNWNWSVSYLNPNSDIVIYSPTAASTWISVKGGGTVRLNYTNLCGSSSQTGFTVYNSCGGYYSLAVSPNPAQDNIAVNISPTDNSNATSSSTRQSSSLMAIDSKGKTILSLFEMNTGVLIKQWKFNEINNQNYNLNINGLRKGVYVLQADRENNSGVTKVIIE